MSYMTSGEISADARWWRSHPVPGPATATLAALYDGSDRFPEGWLYSGVPARAGSALAALIHGDDAARYDRPDATPVALRAALQPVTEIRAAHGPGFPVTSAPPGAADATPRVSGCHDDGTSHGRAGMPGSGDPADGRAADGVPAGPDRSGTDRAREVS
jgi:hypothetical protein